MKQNYLSSENGRRILKGHHMRTLIKVVIGVVIIFCFAMVALDVVDTYKYSCVKNGHQRMVNTFDGLMVEDQLTCKDGRTKWSRSYN